MCINKKIESELMQLAKTEMYTYDELKRLYIKVKDIGLFKQLVEYCVKFQSSLYDICNAIGILRDENNTQSLKGYGISLTDNLYCRCIIEENKEGK